MPRYIYLSSMLFFPYLGSKPDRDMLLIQYLQYRIIFRPRVQTIYGVSRYIYLSSIMFFHYLKLSLTESSILIQYVQYRIIFRPKFKVVQTMFYVVLFVLSLFFQPCSLLSWLWSWQRAACIIAQYYCVILYFESFVLFKGTKIQFK